MYVICERREIEETAQYVVAKRIDKNQADQVSVITKSKNGQKRDRTRRGQGPREIIEDWNRCSKDADLGDMVGSRIQAETMIKHAKVQHAAWPKKVLSISPEAYVCPKPFKGSEIPVSVQLRYYVLSKVSLNCWQREVKEVDDQKHDTDRITSEGAIRSESYTRSSAQLLGDNN